MLLGSTTKKSYSNVHTLSLHTIINLPPTSTSRVWQKCSDNARLCIQLYRPLRQEGLSRTRGPQLQKVLELSGGGC